MIPSPAVCPACYRRFPAGSVLRGLPVGGRVAFDRGRRRLWVVCGECGEWALVPVAGDSGVWRELERLGAGLPAGGPAWHPVAPSLHLAAVRADEWRSYAGFRYAGLIAHRRRPPWSLVAWLAWFAAGGALFLVSATAALGALALGVMALRVRDAAPLATDRLNFLLEALGEYRPPVRGRIEAVTVERAPGTAHGFRLRLRSGSTAPGSFHQQDWTLDGEDALVVARFVLREAARAWRADPEPVRSAVARVDAAGGPRPFLASADGRHGAVGRGSPSLEKLPPALRYALEIAVTELEEDLLSLDPGALPTRWRRAARTVADAGAFPIPGR